MMDNAERSPTLGAIPMRRDPAKAVQVLDMMLEFFDGGRRWTRGRMEDDHGNRCLVGALEYARSVSRARAEGTAELLYNLVPAHQRRSYGHASPRSLFLLRLLMYFNDTCKDYQDVHRVMVRAR
jgi:RimJ/RimL family protein N-acetyltransferase